MSLLAKDIAEDGARDILEQAGKEAMETAIADAIKGAEESAANLLKDSTSPINQQMIRNLVGDSIKSATKDAIASEMKAILETQGREVATQITELAGKEAENATTAVENAVTEAETDIVGKSEADLRKVGEDVLKKPEFNYGKLSGQIMKYTGYAAIAAMMLKGFIGKLGHEYKVRQISVDKESGTITFQVCDDANFSPGDSFKCSGFLDPYKILNDTPITLTQSCINSIKIKIGDTYKDLVSSTTGDCSNPLGIMTCSPDLASNLTHSTGEVLEHMTDAAGDVIKHAADDLGLTGFLGSFGAAFKWIIIGAAIIFVLILLLWIYKQFKG